MLDESQGAVNRSPWHCVEALSSLPASAGVWRRCLGDLFESFKVAFLQRQSADSSDLEDTTPLQLNWSNLGRAIGKAFGLHAKSGHLPIANIHSIGSWSADAVPVFLTIQPDSDALRAVIAEVALRLQRPFILFSPTDAHLDVRCQELLAHAQAAFFSLDSQTRFSEQGVLQSMQPAGILFAKFTPQPNDFLTEDTTRKAFALVKALDSRTRLRPPSSVRVFGLYCIDGMNITEIARRCNCSRGTVLNRLAHIRKQTGADPAQLRRLSTHLGEN